MGDMVAVIQPGREGDAVVDMDPEKDLNDDSIASARNSRRMGLAAVLLYVFAGGLLLASACLNVLRGNNVAAFLFLLAALCILAAPLFLYTKSQRN
jgi:hypothetical protein